MLKERVHKNYASQLQSVLTSVKGVNKTDVLTLGTNFGVCCFADRVGGCVLMFGV